MYILYIGTSDASFYRNRFYTRVVDYYYLTRRLFFFIYYINLYLPIYTFLIPINDTIPTYLFLQYNMIIRDLHINTYICYIGIIIIKKEKKIVR